MVTTLQILFLFFLSLTVLPTTCETFSLNFISSKYSFGYFIFYLIILLLLSSTFEKSILSACFDFKTPITFPISFIEFAQDFIISSQIFFVSSSLSCLGKYLLYQSLSFSTFKGLFYCFFINFTRIGSLFYHFF